MMLTNQKHNIPSVMFAAS